MRSASLEAARSKEEARYTRYGELAETKRAVQSAVMWQLMSRNIGKPDTFFPKVLYLYVITFYFIAFYIDQKNMVMI